MLDKSIFDFQLGPICPKEIKRGIRVLCCNPHSMLFEEAHNLGPVVENDDERETTGKKRQRGGAETTNIWLNLPWSIVLQMMIVAGLLCQLSFFVKNTGASKIHDHFLGR